jgi:hypothetical protein
MEWSESPSPPYDNLSLEEFLDQLRAKQIKTAPPTPVKRPLRDPMLFGDPMIFSDPTLKSDVHNFFGVTASNSNTARDNNAAPPGFNSNRRNTNKNFIVPRYEPAADDLKIFREQASTAQNDRYQGQSSSHIDLQRILALHHCLRKS